MKKKIILSAIMSIALCVSLIAGATFAIFTSESKVNIAVTSGKVDVVATIDETSVKTKQLYDTEYTDGKDRMYQGEVEFTENGLKLNKFLPGDGIKFDIVVKNNSNVAVKYRTVIGCDSDTGLFGGLHFYVNEALFGGSTAVSAYETIEPNSDDVIVSVIVELPEEAGNEYQDTSCTVYFKVEAIQANATVEEVPADVLAIYSAQDLKNFAKQVNDGTLDASYSEIKLMSDIDLDGENWAPIGVSTARAFRGVFDGNGKTISNLKSTKYSFLSGSADYAYGVGLFGNVVSGTVKNLVIENADIGGDYTDDGHVLYSAVGIVAGYSYGDSVFENITIRNSAVKAQTKVGAIVGLNADANKTTKIVDCKIENVTVKGNYSYSLVAGLVLGGSTIDMSGTTVSSTSKTEYWESEISEFEKDGSELEIDGYVWTLSGGVYWMLDNNNAWAVQRGNGAVLTDGYLYDCVVYTSATDKKEYLSSANGEIYAYTAANLQAMSGKDELAGNTVKLMADIDLENVEWTAVAINKLTFDGNNKTIRNLNVKGKKNVGLFGTSTNCIIKNLIVDGANVEGINHVAVIAGDALCAKIEGCTVKNAKIVARTAKNEKDEDDDGDKAAAIAGYLSAERDAWVKDCIAENIEVTGYRDVGGIVGYANSAAVVTGNKVNGLKLTLDNTANYKNYTTIAQHDVNPIIGEYNNGTPDDSNTYENYSFREMLADGLYSDESNYYIENADGLMAMNAVFQKFGQAENIYFSDKSINVMADIDATGCEWETVNLSTNSTDSNGFTFNGNNHTIANLTIAGKNNTNVGAGLFNMTSNNGTGTAPIIKDITFDNVTVNASGHYHVGVIWGECYGDLILENVHVKNSSVTGQCNVGGLVGRNGERNNKITFKDCSVENTKVTSVGGGDPAGASAFLGMACKVGTARNIDLVFEGNNVATGNTLVSAEDHTGGGIYVKAEVVGQNWVSAEVVDEFENYNSQSV